MRSIAVVLLLSVCFSLGCYQSGGRIYLSALEKLGWEKRDLLAKRVTNANRAQQEAKEQFRDALEEFRSVIDHDGGELESKYKKLRSVHEDSAKKAREVRKRIAGIKKVSAKLFDEWQDELEKYSSPQMRQASEKQLAETRRRSLEVIESMEHAASHMDPVLEKLEERVLFLKHNLNARALGSLQETSDALEADVDALIAEMEKSIAEADRFIAEMKPED